MKTVVFALCALLLIAIGVPTAHADATARQDLAAARLATVKYHAFENAVADGYIQVTDCVPGQGFHYLNPDFLDGYVTPTQPEILLYVPKGNRMRLVGVEYAVPDTTDPIPALFGVEFHHAPPAFPLYILHAWIWHGNPDGIFADQNPAIVCP